MPDGKRMPGRRPSGVRGRSGLRATLNRTSAMPSEYPLGGIARQAGGLFERLSRIIRIGGRQLGRHAVFLVVNLLVALIVVSLPFLSSAGSHSDGSSKLAPSPIGSTSLAPVDGEPTIARVA